MGKKANDKIGGLDDFGIGEDFGDGDAEGGENKDEKILMSTFVNKYNLNVSTTEYLSKTLMSVGKVTMGKIISLEFDEEPAFSHKEREVLINLFM